MNGPTKTRTALDPAPGSQCTGVSQNCTDNADDVIHGEPDMSRPSTELVRKALRQGRLVQHYSFRVSGV